MRSSLPFVCTLILIAIMAFPYGIISSASWSLSPQLDPSIRASSSPTFSGILNIIWGDPKVGTGGETRYAIALANGTSVPLQFTGQANTAMHYFGKRVVVSGHVVPNQFATTHVEASTAILVDTIGPQQGVPVTTAGVFGTKKVIYLLLEFSDDSAVPHPPVFYTDLNNPDTPPAGEVFPATVNGFFKKTSWNQFYWLGDVGGVGGVGASGGWLTLPHPKSYYAPCGWSGTCANLQAIGDDGTALGRAQGIVFTNYDNINFVLSNDLDCCAWGGSYYSSVDVKSYGATWEPPWGQETGTYSHEMGHSIGLPHSGWVYYAYDSPWDIMSDRTSANTVPCGSYHSDNDGTTDSVYCTEPGDGYNAAYKDYLGWIPSANEVVTSTSSSATVTLEADALPLGTATKMIKICITGSPCTGSTAHYFTVEARVGGYQFDNGLPGEGVIIQMFEGDRPAVGGPCFFNSQSGWAWPIDATPSDWNGSPACNSGGRSYPNYALLNAQWLPGQTYVNATYGLSVNVVARSGSSFVIAVNPVVVIMTVSYAIVGGGTPSPPQFNYFAGGIPKSLTLSTAPVALMVDGGGSWSVTPNPLSGSTSTERWQTNQVLSGTASSLVTIVFTFYHQYLLTVSYSIVGGGTGYSPPTFTANRYGASAPQTMIGTPTGYWYDSSSPWSVPNPLIGSTGSEGWSLSLFYGLGSSGVVGSAGPMNFAYYHQYLLTLSYSVVGGGVGYSAPMFSARYLGSGIAGHLFLTTTPTNYWFDAGSGWSVDNPLGGSSSSEQWVTSQASGTVSSSQTIAFSYQHQHTLTMQVSPLGGGTTTPTTGWQNADAVVAIGETPSAGFAFSSWSCNGAGCYSGTDINPSITMNNAMTETANFQQIVQGTFTFYTDPTVFVGASSPGSISACGGSFTNGQSSTSCTASFLAMGNLPSPLSGWQFDHWEWAGGVTCTSSASNPASCAASGSGSLTAIYRAQVTFMTNPSSSALISWGSCGAPGEGNGQSIYSTNYGSITACYAPSGYTLSSWGCSAGLSCSGSNDPTLVTFNGPGTITLKLKTGSLTNPVSTSLTVFSTPSSIHGGTTFTVSGRLTANGAGVSGKQIVIVFGWTTNIVTVTTASDGSYTYTATAPSSGGPYDVQVFFLGDYAGSLQYLPSTATARITVT